MLIRDAAYRSLPKETRAELHARFAAWLERRPRAALHEFEEIVGYHLEQAYRFLRRARAPPTPRQTRSRTGRPSGSSRPGAGPCAEATTRRPSACSSAPPRSRPEDDARAGPRSCPTSAPR